MDRTTGARVQMLRLEEPGPGPESAMSRAIIVLDAGSSSLRFSLHQIVNDDPSLVAHGQFDGLGTSPCFKARDRNRSVLVDEELESPSGGVGHAEAIARVPRMDA